MKACSTWGWLVRSLDSPTRHIYITARAFLVKDEKPKKTRPYATIRRKLLFQLICDTKLLCISVIEERFQAQPSIIGNIN